MSAFGRDSGDARKRRRFSRGEHADQMPRDGPAILPASLLGQTLRIAVQFRSGDIRGLFKITFALCKSFLDVEAQFVF